MCRADESWLAITAAHTTREWEALARAIGRDDLVGDAAVRRPSPVATSTTTSSTVAISEWTSDAGPRWTAFHTLQRAGVTAGPQFTEEMLADDPARRRARVDPSDDEPRRRHATRTSGTRSRASPRRGTAARRCWARTTTTCSARCCSSTTRSTSGYVDAKVIVDDYLDPDMNPV